MAVRIESLTTRRRLRLGRRTERPVHAEPADIRTCAQCGFHGRFTIEARGGWADCPNCGSLAW